MKIERIIKEFLTTRVATLVYEGASINFTYDSIQDGGEYQGRVTVLGSNRLEVEFGIANIEEQARGFVMALPTFGYTLFVNDSDVPGTMLLTWESGRQYLSSGRAAILGTLAAIFSEAEIEIAHLYTLFGTKICSNYLLTPRNLAKLMLEWEGVA